VWLKTCFALDHHSKNHLKQEITCCPSISPGVYSEDYCEAWDHNPKTQALWEWFLLGW